MPMQAQQPVIVRIIEPPVESTTVVDVLVGSLGLTAVLLLMALVLGAILGGVLIGVKKFREKYNLEPVPDSEALRVTPAPHG
jgi:membrane protein CcdC involved in cytochrome C biogenesis